MNISKYEADTLADFLENSLNSRNPVSYVHWKVLRIIVTRLRNLYSWTEYSPRGRY